jgi:hypothetical protein
MSATSTINHTVESFVTDSVTDSYIQWTHQYNTAVANADPTLALTVAKEGIHFASTGESVAAMTFDLLDRFGAFWGERDIRDLMLTLGKERAMTDLYVLAASAVTVAGVKRKEGEAWEDVRQAVSLVHRTGGASTKLIVPTVKALVASKREKKSDATIGYKEVARAINTIAENAKVKREVPAQEQASTSLKTMRTNAQKLVLSIQAKDVEPTAEVKFLIGEIVTILNSIK